VGCRATRALVHQRAAYSSRLEVVVETEGGGAVIFVGIGGDPPRRVRAGRRGRGAHEIELTFAEVADLVGGLPRSAYEHGPGEPTTSTTSRA
jgi:hypothetical protein